MVVNNEKPKCTAFTLSVDAKHSIITGISALDRCKTINLLSNNTDQENGILSQRTHKASVDLIKLAGLPYTHVGVIYEIVSEANPLEMARLLKLHKFCEKHNLVLTSIGDMIQHEGY